MVSPVFYKTRLALGGRLSKLDAVRRAQWLPPDAVEDLQRDLLARLLRHAHDHVPYYRRVLELAEVVSSSGRIDLSRFERIPLLDKPLLRAHFDELSSDDLAKRKWGYSLSGGSTGEPIRIIHDSRDDWMRAMIILFDEWSGRRLGEKQVGLWGARRDLQEHGGSVRARWRQRLRNQVWLDAFAMTPDAMREYVDVINRYEPKRILAYAGSIHELAKFIEREGLRVYSPVGIMTSADTLHPAARATIERVFRAPVYDRYGSREAGPMASECDHHEGLHVAVPTHYVEILRADGRRASPGEIGEIVVTCLTMWAMPLIRYRIGDLGAWAEKPCSCGRSWPLLREVTGRVCDNFALPGGGTVFGAFFTMPFFGMDWVDRFQVVQESLQLLRILIVPVRELPPQERVEADLRKVDLEMRAVLGDDVEIVHEFVREIDVSPTGKLRYTISKVSPVES